MTIKVFIENEAGSNIKNLHNENTLEFIKSVKVSRKYPYPYGFILGTTSGDSDNLDCFVITNRTLKTGSIVECESIGLMEQIEDDKQDNNILAVLKGEKIEIDNLIKNKLSEFVSHVFDHLEGKKVKAGNFYGEVEAEEEILNLTDK